jgi:uncharacterized protein (DUF342 family)
MIMTVTQKSIFKIVSQSFESWNVQFRIPKAELQDQESLLYHLRGIKYDLAAQFDLPETCMIFDCILERQELDDSVDIVVRIKRNRLEKGDPKIHLKDGIAQDGTRYSKMRALMDLHYWDDFEKQITMERIRRAIQDVEVDLKLLQQDLIVDKLKEVLHSQTTAKDIEIAVGRFPEIGQDAEIEFCFQACTDLSRMNEYLSARRVHAGDVLCRLIPATTGAKQGVNVVGEILKPGKGMDIELEAGSGVILSSDGVDAIADIDGIVVITRVIRNITTPYTIKEIPKKVTLTVNPVMKIEGDQVLDIETNKTVEVIGSLRMGSKIVTSCEIHITGDVESGTLLAGACIAVNGHITHSTISSDTTILAHGIISQSTLKAKESLLLSGEVNHSKLSGDEVIADSIKSSEIIAKSKVELNRIDDDGENGISKVYVGMNEFYKQRILENEKFQQTAIEKLERIEKIVGKDIMEQITSANVQTMLLKVLARNRAGQSLDSKRQAAVFRTLLESIPAFRDMIEWKKSENINLQKRLKSEKDESSNRLVIKERIGTRTFVTVNGVEAEVAPWDGPVEIYADGSENLIVDRGSKAEP